MPKVTVYRYRRYDPAIDDYRISSRMATRRHIERIDGEIIPGTEAHVDSSHLESDGWTKKNFDPAGL
jgi:hypothetical protein